MADQKPTETTKIRLRRPGAGRKTKISEELIEQVAQLIQAGNYIETACCACGIHRQTMLRWLKKGANAKSGLFRLFCDTVKEATALAEVADITNIANAGAKGAWKASAWRAERRNPLVWGRREQVQLQHTGADGGPIVIEERRKALIAIASNPETRALVEQLARAMAPMRQQLLPSDEQIESDFGLASTGGSAL